MDSKVYTLVHDSYSIYKEDHRAATDFLKNKFLGNFDYNCTVIIVNANTTVNWAGWVSKQVWALYTGINKAKPDWVYGFLCRQSLVPAYFDYEYNSGKGIGISSDK